MMWTYRVIRDNNNRFSVREVFYERDGTIISIAQNPYAPVAASLEELEQEIRWLKKAFELPVLSAKALESKRGIQAANQASSHRKKFSLEQVRAQLGLEVEQEVEPPVLALAAA